MPARSGRARAESQPRCPGSGPLLQPLRLPDPQELEKAVIRGRELGARLEHLQQDLERAALERQEFLQEQENQQQRWGGTGGRGHAGHGGGQSGGAGCQAFSCRYRGLEQRLEAELQAAATSKEEALVELKNRALQLEEELFQVRPGPGPGTLPAVTRGCLSSSLPPDPWQDAHLTPLGACWGEHRAAGQVAVCSFGGLSPLFLRWVEVAAVLVWPGLGRPPPWASSLPSPRVNGGF